MTTTLPSSKRLPLQLPLLEPTENQITVAEIDAFAGALNGCYKEMSPVAKMRALELAHALTKIRFKLNQ